MRVENRNGVKKMWARKLVAEALGTGLLILAVVGSGIMAQRISLDPGTALLANTMATAMALYILITVLAPVSGGHINPIVTLAVALRGDLSRRQAMAYVAAQLIGGICGTLTAHALFGTALLQLSHSAHDGPAQWASELIASFGLIFIILGGLHARANVPALVAAYIAAAIWFTPSSSFANPAGVLARALTNSYTGLRLDDVPAFWSAEILGTLADFVLGRWLFSRDS